MAVRKSEYDILDEADKLLKNFYDNKILHTDSFEPMQLNILDSLVKWDLVEPYLIDEYRISPKGKYVHKEGGIKQTFDSQKLKEREKKIANRKRKNTNLKSGIYRFLNNDWVKGITITVIGGLILYFIIN